MHFVPCCFTPCKTVLIDDDTNYLSQLRLALDKRRTFYEYYNSPHEALNYINGNTPPSSSLWDLQRGDLNNSIHELHQEVFNPERFNRISTVIVDYDMPGMNGIEFCQNLQDSHIQKILLTGVADEQIAIEAFNEGFINHYIKKQATKIFHHLNTYVAQAQKKYFNLLSLSYLESIAGEREIALTDKVFINFFDKFIEEKNIVEFYMLDHSGSFLCLNAKGEASIFYLWNEEGLSLHDELVNELMMEDPTQTFFSSALREELKTRRQIFRFHHLDNLPFPPPEDWHNYIYPLNTLAGDRETYYWSQTTTLKGIGEKNILPFVNFSSQKI